MKFSLSYLLSVVVVAASVGATPAYALTQNLVTFDPPTFSMGPSTYVAAGVAQQIVTTPATFDGGVILGLATFFPAIAFASSPNVYGTANFGDLSLLPTLSISINPNIFTQEVSFALFNGETFTQSYTVEAFSGNTSVATQTLNNVAANFSSGFGLIDINFLDTQNTVGITSLKISATNVQSSHTGLWDFLIDDVAFNQSITSVVPPPNNYTSNQPYVSPPTTDVQAKHGHKHYDYGDVEPLELKGRTNEQLINAVPEPETYAMIMAGLGVMGFIARRRKQV